MAFQLGYADAARMLYQAVFVQRGFSARQIAEQARVAARTGLWGERAPAGDPPPAMTAAFAIDLAVTELRQLVELTLRSPPSPPPAVEVPGLPPTIGAEPGRGARAIDVSAMAALCERLCASLRANDVARIEPILEEVRHDLLSQQRWNPRDHADASIDELAAGMVASQLHAFFDRNRDFCWVPFGSATLFAAVARLPAGGLGPYLGNVGQLLRSANDLMGLALLAGADDGSGRSVEFQRWLVLLATHLGSGERIDLVEQLADHGLVHALAGVFGTTPRAADRDSRLPWIVRDAALDLGMKALASQAQARIVGLLPDRVEEWVVLAEVLGGIDDERARQALAEALRLNLEHEGALERSAILEAGGFGAFEVLSGLGSPPWRVTLRARHRRADAPTGGAEPEPAPTPTATHA